MIQGSDLISCFRIARPARGRSLIVQMESSMEVRAKKFRELFCEQVQCPPEAFEQKVLSLCLYRHALPFAGIVRILRPGFFEKDIAVIRQLGMSTSQVEFNDEVKDYFYRVHSSGNILQRFWRIRISGKRLIRLSRLFAPNPKALANQPP